VGSSRPSRYTAATALSLALVGALLAGCGGSSEPYGRYVALGDSYTAAPGEGPGEVAPCNRSSDNYPHLVATAIDADVTDASCAGATLDDLTSSQADGVAPQLDALTSSTKLVTIGIGGNDLDLGGFASGCASGADCPAAADRLLATVPALTQRLIGVLAQIRQKAPSAKVVVVGYPLIIAGSCAEAPLPSEDVPLLVKVNTRLDEALSSAASTAKVAYADVLTPSKGHDICGSDPWIAGISGQGAQPLHPKSAEQHAVAEVIRRLL
jgi:lysophospholipase L1-like esterase